MEKNSSPKVCVTGGSGYIGSWLVKKLLKNGYTVHVTLRNLGDDSKVGLLKSLPNADAKLVLFQADIYNPHEFEAAIDGCDYVFHVAVSWQHDPKSTLFKDKIEANIAVVRRMADLCIRSQTVKRLIYTASVMSCSPLNEHGSGFKSSPDESCWTPLNLSFTHCNDYTFEYTRAKTLAEKEALSYNEIDDAKLEVVTLACGLVGGETLLSSVPMSVQAILSQVTGNPFGYEALRYIEELLGSVPLVHIDDVCEAHVFAMEKPSMKGRFLCAVTSPTVREMANYYEENYSDIKIDAKFKGDLEKGIACESGKLVDMGFEFKCDMKKIIGESLESGRRLGALSHQ
uniref:NAD-dependent epimerase/dehydratase domain-containing protein n=1 Tax=Rhizophora mucronata TaxID=61149 RepID=A0A2P2JUR3_RHIMU